MKLLNPYLKEEKKTIRTNIDGDYTCKIDECIKLEKGDIVEISGKSELYKTQRMISELPQNPSFEYYINRGYSEVGEFGLVKSANLTEMTMEARRNNCELIGETFIENKYKENYEIFGIGFQFDGRLSKNQIVRMGNNVITITDLVKPEEKGGLIKVIGVEVSRVILDSVHRVYVKEEEKLQILAEYENWGDAIMLASKFNERNCERAFL